MPMDDLGKRFNFHPATDVTGPIHAEVRAYCFELSLNLDKLLPDGREKSLAITKLEEVMFWSNAAIVRNS